MNKPIPTSIATLGRAHDPAARASLAPFLTEVNHMGEIINLEAWRLCKRQQELAVEAAELFHLDVAVVQEYAAALAEQEIREEAVSQ